MARPQTRANGLKDRAVPAGAGAVPAAATAATGGVAITSGGANGAAGNVTGTGETGPGETGPGETATRGMGSVPSRVDPLPSAVPQLRQKRSPSRRSSPQLGQYLVWATGERYAAPRCDATQARRSSDPTGARAPVSTAGTATEAPPSSDGRPGQRPASRKAPRATTCTAPAAPRARGRRRRRRGSAPSRG